MKLFYFLTDDDNLKEIFRRFTESKRRHKETTDTLLKKYNTNEKKAKPNEYNVFLKGYNDNFAVLTTRLNIKKNI